MENKTFKIIDKSGRSGKPYKFSEKHIRDFWDLLEEDWNGQKLEDFLEDSYIGDVWETRDAKIECVKIINN